MLTRRWRLVVGLLAAVVVLGGVFLAHGRTQRQLPVVVDPACPALLTGTSNATEDFADVVTWTGRTYVGAVEGLERHPGDVAGVVSCSIAEMDNPDGWRVAPGAWPDGTATRLPRGTVLRAAGERALVAEEPDGPTLYCEADPSTLDPTC